MKKRLDAFAVTACLLLGLACAACDCSHEFGEWETVAQVTCTADGMLQRFCAKCNERETTTIAATGHRFGDWSDQDGMRIRRCSVCGYAETINNGGSGGNSGNGGNGGNSGTIEPVNAVYSSLDQYLADCDRSGNDIYYKGTATRLSAEIGQGDPDFCTFYIPEHVSYVKFIGRPQGNPFYDTRFIVQTRSSDLEVEFQGIEIESNRTIFSSETRNINLSLVMSGDRCNFLVTRVGANGSGGSSSGVITVQPSDGTPGENGVDAFVTYGTCTLSCKAQRVTVKGGDAGNGGDGGSAWGWNGHTSGNGGKGGDGGAAFVTETNRIVNVLVYGNSDIIIQGGSGGRGGSAGSSDKGHCGSNGANGKNGATGCKEPYQYQQ